jgi:hypothetical protein
MLYLLQEIGDMVDMAGRGYGCRLIMNASSCKEVVGRVWVSFDGDI